jgi:hypothetical protein
MELGCWQSSKTVHLVSCVIAVDNATQADAGFYTVGVANDQGALQVDFQIKVEGMP